MFPTLITQRLALRAWQPQDLDRYQAISADAEVMRFIGDGTPRAADSAKASFDRMTEAWRKHGFGIFAVEDLSTEALIGLCGLEPVDSSIAGAIEAEHPIEIGWRLDRTCWGKGLATEAATAVADWAFSADAGLDLPGLLAIVQVKNEASIRVADRLQMTRCQRTIVPGHQRWVDVFELSHEAWTTRDVA